MKFLDNLDDIDKHTFQSNNTMSKFKIKDIFNDHWFSFLHDNPDINIRPVVHKKVDKMMGCDSLSNGFAVYTCDNCRNYLCFLGHIPKTD